MNISLKIVLIFSLIQSGCLYSRSKIKYPNLIKPEKVSVVHYANEIVTIIGNNNDEVWQFKASNAEITFHFKFKEAFERQLYNVCKNDKGESYQRVKRIYELNDVKDPIKMGRFYVTDDNRIFTIIEAYDLKPVSKKNIGKIYDPDKDFELNPFHVLVEVGNDTILSYLPIENIYSNTGYFLQGGIDFFKEGQDWFFSVAQVQLMHSGKNYFLGCWKEKQHRLVFDSFIPLEVPNFNKKNVGGYGLMDFIHRNKSLMLYSTPCLFDLEKKEFHELKVNSSTQANYFGKQKGDFFAIPISICDYFIKDDEVKVIVRDKSKFYIYYYSRKDYKLITMKEIDNYVTSDLYRFPFFSNEGKVVFTPKTSNEILIE